MRFAAVVLSCLLGYALGAPAIVWKSGKDLSESVIHSSNAVDAASVLSEVIHDSGDASSLNTAIFLLDRTDSGSERLSELASSGSLSGIASKYNKAHCIHHHVTGIESPFAMASLARRHEPSSVEISLSEFFSLTSEKPTKAEIQIDSMGIEEEAAKRAELLNTASVVVVKIPASTESEEIDRVVVDAIENSKIQNVMLAGLRSTEEVKDERIIANRRRMSGQQKASNSILLGNRRRLEEGGGDDDANNGNNNGGGNDMEGVYYVHMTPNIFAGILYAIFFAFVAITGFQCMGMIQGQDVYVKKMPTIGREA
jgi:hypothetical protein